MKISMLYCRALTAIREHRASSSYDAGRSGIWLFHRHVADHMDAGTSAYYQVLRLAPPLPAVTDQGEYTNAVPSFFPKAHMVVP
jgi:hypothetical protein